MHVHAQQFRGGPRGLTRFPPWPPPLGTCLLTTSTPALIALPVPKQGVSSWAIQNLWTPRPQEKVRPHETKQGSEFTSPCSFLGTSSRGDPRPGAHCLAARWNGDPSPARPAQRPLGAAVLVGPSHRPAPMPRRLCRAPGPRARQILGRTPNDTRQHECARRDPHLRAWRELHSRVAGGARGLRLGRRAPADPGQAGDGTLGDTLHALVGGRRLGCR